MSGNQALATEVLTHLARLGVREFVVAAGARNAPLLAPLLASRNVKVWNFFDERSAAFFALGRIIAERMPVAVVTTSGTAAGELLPAAMEAHYQALPLVLVTADRPARFRCSGAPQAVEQIDLFVDYTGNTRDFGAHDLEPRWPDRLGLQPLHVNVCFEEMQIEDIAGIDFDAPVTVPTRQLGGWQDEVKVHTRSEGQRGLEKFIEDADDSLLVVVGGLHPAHAAKAAIFLQQLGVPIVAEATSNLLNNAGVRHLLVPGGEKALRELKPRHVLRIGAVPSWRWWRDLENLPDVKVTNVTPALYAGLARRKGVSVPPVPWLTSWPGAAPAETAVPPTESKARGATPDFTALISRLDETIARHLLSEPTWIRHISESIPAGARVFLGNSLPIREWNLSAASPQPGTTFFANRGANGIDGIVSTFLGVSATSGESWLIIGDLSALYDLSAPWILRRLPAGNRRIVVINNGGGKIFSRVDSLRSLDERTREVIENRHSLSFEPWARMWGMNYTHCTSADQLAALPDGNVIVEIIPDAGQTELFWKQWNAS